MNSSSSMMVSINVPKQTLKGFDRLCRLIGKTRTAVLVELMRSFVLKEGQTIVEQVQQMSSLARTVDKLIKTRVERRSGDQLSNQPETSNKAILRRFSDFS